MGDTYYYTYCTNFSHTLSGVDFGRGDIVVMESDSPLGPWSEPKLAFANQAQFFGAGTGGNNHHAFFDFQGSWYLTYHAQTLDVAIEDGASAGYRNAHIDKVDMGADGTIAPVTGTYAGPGQKAAFDPYEGPVSAETIAWQAGTRQGVRRHEHLGRPDADAEAHQHRRRRLDVPSRAWTSATEQPG